MSFQIHETTEGSFIAQQKNPESVSLLSILSLHIGQGGDWEVVRERYRDWACSL